MVTRREMIIGAATSALVPVCIGAQPVAVNRQQALAAALQREGSLAASAARLGILFGTAAEPEMLYNDDAYAGAVAHECSLIVPENSLKPAATRGKPDGFDFRRAERLYAFASNHKMAFRGHTLVWYANVPEWVKTASSTADAARTEMLLEVTEPCKHFRGRVDSWDVVNEALDPNTPSGLRSSFWLQMLGPDYIPMAFTAAREADPNALLVFNENHIECDVPSQDKKRRILIDLLRTMRQNNVPVDALGIESHLGDAAKFPFNPSSFDRFLSEVHDLGLKILVTELDVTDKDMPADVAARDAAVARVDNDFLSVVLRHPGVITVNVWGLSDRHSWLSSFSPRADGLSTRPTLLDSNLTKKAAYVAVRTAFDYPRKR